MEFYWWAKGNNFRSTTISNIVDFTILRREAKEYFAVFGNVLELRVANDDCHAVAVKEVA
jgi:hypothetical protein